MWRHFQRRALSPPEKDRAILQLAASRPSPQGSVRMRVSRLTVFMENHPSCWDRLWRPNHGKNKMLHTSHRLAALDVEIKSDPLTAVVAGGTVLLGRLVCHTQCPCHQDSKHRCLGYLLKAEFHSLGWRSLQECQTATLHLNSELKCDI